MKKIGAVLICAALTVLAGCGNDKDTVNGNWAASLMTNQSATAVMSFKNTFTLSSTSLDTSNFQFTASMGCFAIPTTVTSTSMNNNPSDIGMIIQSAAPDGSGTNILTLQGTMAGGSISGTWIMTGTQPECNTSGSFTMTRVPGPQTRRP